MKKMKKDVVNDNNLKVLMSDDSINILIEIKDIHIDNDKVKQAMLYCLSGKVEELKTDMTCLKNASKSREIMEDNTQVLTTIIGAMVKSNLESLRIKKKMMIEFMTNPEIID